MLIDHDQAFRKMPLITQAEERGIQQGWQQGMEQGLHLGGQAIVCHLLQNRFGVLTSDIKAQVAGLSFFQLHLLSVAEINVTKLDDLSEWIEAQLSAH